MLASSMSLPGSRVFGALICLGGPCGTLHEARPTNESASCNVSSHLPLQVGDDSSMSRCHDCTW